MLYRAHRGIGRPGLPENTMPAFRIALENGFEQIETDPNLTKDGQIVLMHDFSINRTCRNADGSAIKEELLVSSLTYGELMEYDAGIAFGEEFRGTRVPLLSQLLELLDGSDVVLDLDKKIPTARMDPFLDLVKKYNVRAEFSCADTERIQKVLSRIPNALINYDGNTREEDLERVCALVPYDRLTVWMYYDNPHFAWLTDRYKTSPENCARVKKYAKLGIANVLNTFEMRDAINFGADIIEPFG